MTSERRTAEKGRRVVCTQGHTDRKMECCRCCGWGTRTGLACCADMPPRRHDGGCAMTASRTFKQASDLLAARANAATGDKPRWELSVDEYGDKSIWASRDDWDYYPQTVLSEHDLRKTPGAFDHFAALTPEVATAAARLFSATAAALDELESYEPQSDAIPTWLHAELENFARTYLGTLSTGAADA